MLEEGEWGELRDGGGTGVVKGRGVGERRDIWKRATGRKEPVLVEQRKEGLGKSGGEEEEHRRESKRRGRKGEEEQN